MRTLLATLLVAAALGKRAGNTLMPRAEDDRTASLMQYTDRHPPAAEAVRSAATTALRATYTRAAETELFDAEDCTRVMGPNGLCACCNTWTLAQLSSLYTHGQPDNALPSVGLTVHGFDGTLQGNGNNPGSLAEYNVTGEKEEPRAEPVPLAWAPCDKGWCENAAKWLSTSIINSEHRAGYSDGGMILKPGGNKVLCSHYYDFSSLESGCAGGVHRNHTGDTPFPAEQLKEMLETSMTYKQAYNEVLVDSAVYKSNLPDSVAAFYYGLLPDEGNSTWSRVQTTAMYVAFLDHYQLSESQVPLVEFALDNPDTHGLLTDVSAGARKFLKAHPYGYALKRWREEHPELSEHPERIHLELRKRADERRKEYRETRAAMNAAKAAGAEVNVVSEALNSNFKEIKAPAPQPATQPATK